MSNVNKLALLREFAQTALDDKTDNTEKLTEDIKD